MIRAYYLDIEDKFERLKLEAYLMDHGFEFFNATEYDPYTSGPDVKESITAIRADLEATRG